MKKFWITLALGLAGFCLPLLLPLPGLALPGQITLGIFLLAAVFWVMEPIPIYATSLVVILLQTLFLSIQGPFAQWSTPATLAPVDRGDGVWEVPAKAVADDAQLFLWRAGRAVGIPAEVVTQEAGTVRVRVADMEADSRVITNTGHWRVGFQPPSYTAFLNTLASPIIILFLGGFVMAAGAAKYRVDRNLIRIILKPFGSRPANVMIGMMAVTALLSAFMSNTATTAMMMAVVVPVLASAPEGDRFRMGLALAVPFAANIGGIATPIGTPPNAIALGALAEQGIVLPFTTWMALTVPLVAIMLVFIWFLLMRAFPSKAENLALELKGSFDTSRKAWILYIVAGSTILLWVTEAIHGMPSSLIALLPIALLTAFEVVDKKEIRSLPWEVLWLMAGGLALGVAMRETGLAIWMVDQVPWGIFGALGALALFGLVAILLANFIANTVAATLLMPLVISLVTSGVADGFALQTAAITVALGTSLGMSLPVSTPPNAIAMSTGLVRTVDMARMGVIIGAVGYAVLLAMAFAVWNNLF